MRFTSTVFVVTVTTFFASSSQADDLFGPAAVEVSSAVNFDLSPMPLSELEGVANAAASSLGKVKPLHILPKTGNASNQTDGAQQKTAGLPVGTTSGLNFAGIGQGDYGYTVQWIPPDTVGAVGDTQYVQWVNSAIAVFDKSTGAIATGFPKEGNSAWAGFGGDCETNNDGDPIVQYDKLANRWILTQFSVSTKPYLQCVAVSTTSDATGSYYRYSFSYGNNDFNDYPKLGVWADGYYMSYNIFNITDNGETFVGSKVCAFDRAKMLVGDPTATQQCFQLGPNYFGLMPSDIDGTTAPPKGSPNFFMSLGVSSLNLWKFHVDFADSTKTTLTGPINIGVAKFTSACNENGSCIPQKGTWKLLDGMGGYMMYRLAYRNRAGVESLIVNHSVMVRPEKITSVRWYEVRNLNYTAPAVFQQGTLLTADGTHRWVGSMAMDKQGNIALGYSASSRSTFPSIRYTGRLATDALGTMRTEAIIVNGGGCQAADRWGDYSSMTVDPVDDCTFWYTNQYLKTRGKFNWSTRIASFKFPGCQ